MSHSHKFFSSEPNFAGHYVVVTKGCGGNAICGEIFDALSGKVVAGFPNAYQLNGPDDDFYDADFKSWSRLLIISGVAADPEVGVDGKLLLPCYRTRYYEFRDERLILIRIDEGR
ncbi:hypothetical protein [Pseudomonas sp. PDM22]|uniref:hypothetical protein n=1 Tax=Pseudomonas sp. PDM22 TaxID=2769287 RepID=UPI00111C784F|nr:hypothetical protein [Pseudomonas sp. PDM22]MBD9516103.1 hypothetical protein [Pseudomonas sp. PDM22]